MKDFESCVGLFFVCGSVVLLLCAPFFFESSSTSQVHNSKYIREGRNKETGRTKEHHFLGLLYYRIQNNGRLHYISFVI